MNHYQHQSCLQDGDRLTDETEDVRVALVPVRAGANGPVARDVALGIRGAVVIQSARVLAALGYASELVIAIVVNLALWLDGWYLNCGTTDIGTVRKEAAVLSGGECRMTPGCNNVTVTASRSPTLDICII